MRRVFLALAGPLLLGIGGPAGGAGPFGEYASGDVEACLQALPGSVDEEAGTHDLSGYCPGLAARIAAAAGAGKLSGVSPSAASRAELRDLGAFAASFERDPALPTGAALDFEGLDALLADVLVEEDDDEGPWRRLLEWLEQRMGDGGSGDFGWLVDFLESISPPVWVWELIYKGLVVLIIVLALVVVGNEARISGLLRGRRHRGRAGGPVERDESPRASGPRTFDELRSLPPRARAGALLTLVVAGLCERGWLSAGPSDTNGELLAQLRRRHASMTAAFGSLVRSVESVVYGDRELDPGEQDHMLATARDILEESARTTPTAGLSA